MKIRKYALSLALLSGIGLALGGDLSERDILLDALSSDKNRPTIKISGSYSSSTLDDSGEMSLIMKTDIEGLIDLSSGNVDVRFDNCSRRLATQPVTYDTSSFIIRRDKEKWVLVKFPSNRNELPQGATSLTQVSEGVPKIFLKSADALGFPLFPTLADVYVDQERVPFLAALSDAALGGKLTASVRNEGPKVEVVFKSHCTIDSFSFDILRGMAFMSRVTDFGGCVSDATQPKLVNRLEIVDSTTLPSGLVFPKNAVFVQTLGDQVKVRREWKIDISETNERVPLAVTIPSSSYVTDERFGISFFTKREQK